MYYGCQVIKQVMVVEVEKRAVDKPSAYHLLFIFSTQNCDFTLTLTKKSEGAKGCSLYSSV